LLLAGDIGGTKTALALFSAQGGLRAPVREREYLNGDYASFEAIIAAFLSSSPGSIESACFAVAGPVIRGRARITNEPWLVEERALAASLGVAVRLLNDVEAVAAAVPLLGEDDLITLRPGQPQENGTIAVIAPGTGLGESFLVRADGREVAHASEGGHAAFAPRNELQLGLWRYLHERYGHVSFERVCSGIGIANIYDFLVESGYAQETPEVLSRLKAVEDRTPVIVSTAMEQPSPSVLCSTTIDVFVDVLAAEAGNLALKVLATGGVYFGGGLPVRVLPRLQDPAFLTTFEDKGRMKDLLQPIPLRVITSNASLLGAAKVGLALGG
jgi:glucokinase